MERFSGYLAGWMIMIEVCVHCNIFLKAWYCTEGRMTELLEAASFLTDQLET